MTECEYDAVAVPTVFPNGLTARDEAEIGVSASRSVSRRPLQQETSSISPFTAAVLRGSRSRQGAQLAPHMGVLLSELGRRFRLSTSEAELVEEESAISIAPDRNPNELE